MERNVKPTIIATLGDIAMAVGGWFERYMPYVMMMLQQASQLQLDPSNVEDFDYLSELRESILSTYTSIVQGLSAENKCMSSLFLCARFLLTLSFCRCSTNVCAILPKYHLLF